MVLAIVLTVWTTLKDDDSDDDDYTKIMNYEEINMSVPF